MKNKIFRLSLITLLMFFSSVIFQVKVFASDVADGYAEDWFNHISLFDYGTARCEVISPHEFELYEEIFFLVIDEEPANEFIDFHIEYGREDLNYFEPRLQIVLQDWFDYDFYYEDFGTQIEMVIGPTNFDGYLYWNFEEQYWQIDYYKSFGYVEEEGFTTYRYQFFETGGQVVVDFTYPSVVFAGYEIPIEIELISVPSDDESFTINRVQFFGIWYDVTVTEFERDTVNLSIPLGLDYIIITNLRYVYNSFMKTKTDDVDMPVTVIESELDYYRLRYYSLKNEIESLNDEIESLNDEISLLQEEIEDLEEALLLEFTEGYFQGFAEGIEEGYNDGYEDGYDAGLLVNYNEAYEEGFDDGYNEGFDMGLEIGREEGYDYGYNLGYEEGEKSKLAENNETFYNNIEKWLVPAIITVIALGGFVSIAAIKRREQ